MTHTIHELTAKDGLQLFYQKWSADKEKGLLCLIHGLGEYSGSYSNMAQYLTDKGYSLAALDLRGHGRSRGKRGHAGSYGLLMSDIDMFISHAAGNSPELPRFLYGHSMGGNLVLNYCLRYSTSLAGVIASGPWLKLVKDPPGLKVVLSRIMDVVYPSLTMNNGLKSEALYHKEERTEDYFKDPLFHSMISARLYRIISESGLWALDHAGELKLPALVMHGGADKITSPQASMDFVKKAPQAGLKIWDDFLHVLQNEPRHDEVFQYVVDWMDKLL